MVRLMTKLDVNNVRESLEVISNENSDLLIRYPISIYIGFLDTYPTISDYHYISPDVVKLVSNVDCLGRNQLVIYHKILLLNLIIIRFSHGDFDVASNSELLQSDLHRIYSDVVSLETDCSCFLYSSDKFSKSLAICLNRLKPFGAQKVCISSIPRGFIFKSNISQVFRGTLLLINKIRGWKPVYEMHTDSNDAALLEQFSSDGWALFYKRIAEELMVNTKIKALYGTSWFFDPSLKDISPRLSYLLELPLAHGAEVFLIGPSDSARKSALATSTTRVEMYAAGKYEPTDYMLVWAREDMLRWLNSLNLNGMEIIDAK